jgi:hypothetical protein
LITVKTRPSLITVNTPPECDNVFPFERWFVCVRPLHLDYLSAMNDALFKCFEPFTSEEDKLAVLDRCTLRFVYTQPFSGDVRMKQSTIIEEEAGAILPLLVLQYGLMLNLAPENSNASDWRPFIPYFQGAADATDSLIAWIKDNCEASQDSRNTVSLRQIIDKYDGEITWEELEKRLLAALAAINAEQGTSYSYDAGKTFYRCLFCDWHLDKNKHTATAEVYCCPAQEQHKGKPLKERTVLYDSTHTSEGKPRKFATLPKKVR